MATLYGVNADKRLVDVPSTKIDSSDQGGRMRVAYDSYTVSSNLSSADVIKLGKIPAGARVYETVIACSAGLGASVDGDLGHSAGPDGTEAADDDAFGAAIDLNVTTVTKSMDPTDAGYAKQFSEDVDVELLLNDAVTASSQVIHCWIMYALD